MHMSFREHFSSMTDCDMCDKLSEICCKLSFDGKFDSKNMPECRIGKVLEKRKRKRGETCESSRLIFLVLSIELFLFELFLNFRFRCSEEVV